MREQTDPNRRRPRRIDLVIIAVAAALFAWIVTGDKAAPITTGLGTALAWYFLGYPIIPIKTKGRTVAWFGKRMLTVFALFRRE